SAQYASDLNCSGVCVRRDDLNADLSARQTYLVCERRTTLPSRTSIVPMSYAFRCSTRYSRSCLERYFQFKKSVGACSPLMVIRLNRGLSSDCAPFSSMMTSPLK